MGFSDPFKRPSVTDYAIALFTLVLAIVSYFQWKEIHHGGKDTRILAEATLASSRAWVDPEQIVLGSPIEAGLPLKYQIRLVNAGKEPAIGVVWNLKSFGVPYIGGDSTNGSSSLFNVGENGTCAGLDPDPKRGTVLYPSGNANFWLPLSIPDTLENRSLLEAIKNRKQSLMIEGCFAYITAGQKHTSSFRFFLRDIPGPSFASKQGSQSAAWNFNMALSGNHTN